MVYLFTLELYHQFSSYIVVDFHGLSAGYPTFQILPTCMKDFQLSDQLAQGMDRRLASCLWLIIPSQEVIP